MDQYRTGSTLDLDQLHSQYSSSKHDNPTIASVAALMSLRLSWRHYEPLTSFEEAVDLWKLCIPKMLDFISLKGSLLARDQLNYSDFTAEREDYVQKFLVKPHLRLRYHIGTDLLSLPSNHPLIRALEATTTTTTVAPRQKVSKSFREAMFEFLGFGYIRKVEYFSPFEFWRLR